MYKAWRLQSYVPIHHPRLLTEMKRVTRPRPREQQQTAPCTRGLCCGVRSNGSAGGQVEPSTFRQECTEIFSPRTPLGLATLRAGWQTPRLHEQQDCSRQGLGMLLAAQRLMSPPSS